MSILQRNQREEIALGIDYGDTNIGVAFGRNGLAAPVAVVSAKNPQSAIQEIAKIAVENKANVIVFGLPKDSNGNETPQCLKVRRFAKLLRVYLKMPTKFVDEYLSTQEALQNAIALDTPTKKRKSLDAVSAAIILKKYFREESL